MFRTASPALPATANQAVHAGLREGVFGLTGDTHVDGDGAIALHLDRPDEAQSH